MNYLVQACTDIGIVKDTNQDSFSVKVFNTPMGVITFAIMCDGMGGLAKGEVASASVVSAFMKWADETLVSITSEKLNRNYISMEWNNIVVSFNEKIKAYGNKNGVKMGTTATILLLSDYEYYVANIGDTRLYEITDNYVSLITKDQTVVARDVETGVLTQEQANNDPRRSILLQCIGASDRVYPDFFFGKNKKDAVYILCTDGFRHEISQQEIHNYLCPSQMNEENKMRDNIITLIEMDKQRHEQDNISVIAIRTY